MVVEMAFRMIWRLIKLVYVMVPRENPPEYFHPNAAFKDGAITVFLAPIFYYHQKKHVVNNHGWFLFIRRVPQNHLADWADFKRVYNAHK